MNDEPSGGMKDMRSVLIAASAAIVLASCAKAPESISASYISDVGYQQYTCDQLGSEMSRLSSALALASAQQEKARTNDVVGVILIGLPVSSMSGDNIAPEIARLKGEQEAVRRAAMIKRCPSSGALPAQGQTTMTPAKS